MKVVLYVSLVALFFMTTEALICYECSNALSNDQCNAGLNGGLKNCPSNALSCENLVRTLNGETRYFKECKQPQACRNNLKGNVNGPQCRPNDPIHSECWCCCSGEDYCNRGPLCLGKGTNESDTTAPTCIEPERPINGYTRCGGVRELDDTFRIGSTCDYGCVSGFTLSGSTSTTCSRDEGVNTASFNRSPPECIPPPVCPPPNKPVNGEVNCLNSVPPNEGYPLGSVCEYSCKGGYTLNGPDTTTCRETTGVGVTRKASFDPPPPICTPPTCLPPNKPENGDVDCGEEVSPDGRYSLGSQCIYYCNKGYIIDGPDYTTCTESVEGSGEASFEPQPPICSAPPTCPPPNKPENGDVLCGDEVFPDGRYSLGSRCIYYCNKGYIIDGPDYTTCTESVEGSGEASFEPQPPICSAPPTCPPPNKPVNGDVFCGEEVFPDGRYSLGSQCIYVCNEGYIANGPDYATCTESVEGSGEAFFDPQPPICSAPPTCAPPNKPVNGDVLCGDRVSPDGRYSLESQCIYYCNKGYMIDGPDYTICTETFEGSGKAIFDPEPPICKAPPCVQLDDIENGEVSCPDGTKREAICEFSCNKGYSLSPYYITETECLNNSTWSNPNPCCLENCSPDALIDYVIVLDSSSSISSPNWDVMLKFTTAFIRNLNIRSDAANVGVFRYNRRVDFKTRIFLNKYRNDKAGLINAVQRMTYSVESGTKTGAALRYARRTMFNINQGDRPNAHNTLIVVTDGRDPNTKFVIEQSAFLRDANVLTYAIGIQAAGNKLDIEQLMAIAGSLDHLRILDRGFQELSQSLAASLSETTCASRECPGVPK